MVTDIRPRVVAAPWEPESARRLVGLEADVAPEAGPLALYRSVFPERYVVWDRPRQLFEIRQQNPETGHDERCEFVFTWDAPPDAETGQPRTAAEVAELLAAPGAARAALVRRFRPFDYVVVLDRLRQWWDFRALGPKRYSDALAAKNARQERTVVHDAAREMAAGLGEIRRWMPALAEYQTTGRADLALVEKPVLVPGASFPSPA